MYNINFTIKKAGAYLKSVAECNALLIDLSFPVVTLTCFIANDMIEKMKREMTAMTHITPPKPLMTTNLDK